MWITRCLACVQIRFRYGMSGSLDIVFFRFIPNHTLEPVHQLAIIANKDRHLIDQGVHVHNMLRIQVECFEKLFIRGLVTDMFTDTFKEFNLFCGYRRFG